MEVESAVGDGWDDGTDWPATADQAVRAAVRHSDHPALADRPVEVSVRFTGDEEVRALNAAWRGKDKATNVLSFPMAERSQLAGAAMLGDIVIARETVADEAEAAGLALDAHVAHLVVHGTLHLLGYDHEGDEAEAGEMEEVERRALASLGIADPYRVTQVPHHG